MEIGLEWMEWGRLRFRTAWIVLVGMEITGENGAGGGDCGWVVGCRRCDVRTLMDIAVRIRVLDSGAYGGSHAGDGGAALRYVKHGFAAI